MSKDTDSRADHSDLAREWKALKLDRVAENHSLRDQKFL